MDKKYCLIVIAAILFVATAGCLDDKSTKSQCSGIRTSVITVDHSWTGNMESQYSTYIYDSDGYVYTWENVPSDFYDMYNGHNVTFQYSSKNGHLRFNTVIKDYDEKKDCLSEKLCNCGCDCK